MPVFYDQLNRVVSVPAFPKRIISIVPSQTELLFYMGLDAANENTITITNKKHQYLKLIINSIF